MGSLRLLIGPALLLAACAAASASTLFYADNSLFFETFDKGWESRWIHSKNARFNGRLTTSTPRGWKEEGLSMPERSKFYGISALTKQPIDVADNLVVQYEVRFTEGLTCGGAYLKLLTYSSSFTPEALTNETPYSIMFGPDSCGTSKVHLIFRHRNPKTGTITEKHLKSPPSVPADEETHIYTLVLNSAANKYEILIDGTTQAAGSLLKDFDPPFAPKKEIRDPTDKKPADWADNAKIPDPTATKPADWDDRIQIPDEAAKKPSGWLDDEPPTIPDPAAKEPEDWDEEEDGKWEAAAIPNPKCKVGCGEWKRPLKHNPAYKGPWKPPMIDNPAYKGPWKQRRLPNPDYYEERRPLQNVGEIGAVAIEVWTVDAGFTFDNIMLTNDASIAREFRDRAFRAKKKAEDFAEGRSTRDLTSLAEATEAMLLAVLEREPFRAILPVVRPLFNVMKKYPPVAYGVVLGSLTLLFYLIAICIAGSKNNHPEVLRRKAAEARKAAKRDEKLRRAAAKKKDDDADPNEDDDEDEDEDEEDDDEVVEEVVKKAAVKGEGKVAAGAKKAAEGVEAAAAAAATEDDSDRLRPVEITEIEEDDEEEEEEASAAAKARQRKPKA